MDCDKDTVCSPTELTTDLAQKAEDLGIEYFIPCLPSLSSDARGPLVPRSAAKKLQTDGFNIHGIVTFKTPVTEPKLFAIPDVTTLIQLPWDTKFGWLMCDIYLRGQPLDCCPRQALKKVHRAAREKGFILKTGIEPEFYLLKKDKHEVARKENPSAYQDPVSEMQQQKFLCKVLDAMDKMGWKPYQAEHEGSECQFEINFAYENCETTADRLCFLKFMIKEIALREGFRACFMPQPFNMKFGSGLHVNMSLRDIQDDRNLIPDVDGTFGISEFAQQFLAGLMLHAEGLCAITCPTVNSYKRLHAIESFLNLIAYAEESRIPMMRIVRQERLEMRNPDAAANPYLLHAAILAAGIDGIEKHLVLDPAMNLQEDLVRMDCFPDLQMKPAPKHFRNLPRTLLDALSLLEKDEILSEKLGKKLIEVFIHIKRGEWRMYTKHVSDWETETADDY